MKKQLLILCCNAAVLLLSVLIFPGIEYRTLSAVIGMGIVSWLVNLFLRPILLLLTLPLNLITFGLMSLLVNTWTLRIADKLTKGFSFPNFGTAFLVALLLMAVRMLLIDNKDSVLMRRLSQ